MIGIVGGAGFVGTRLSKVLSEADIAHKILDKVLTGERHIDITDPSTFRVLSGVTAIINLAAEHRDDVSPKTLYDLVNVEGSRNLCNYATQKGINKMIFTSSVAVYGFAPEGTDETGEIDYFNDYGRTKYEAEEVYRKWYNEDQERRDLIIIRPTVIFGEQNRGNVYNLLKQIASGRFIMFGDGANRKSMAYVQNIAECLKHVTKLNGYNLYNYIDKPDLDMNALVRTCRKALSGRDGVGIRLPGWLGLLVGYLFDLLAFILRKKLPVSSIRVKKFMGTTAFSTSIASTGFKPTHTLAEGLERTLRHEFTEDHKSDKVFYSE